MKKPKLKIRVLKIFQIKGDQVYLRQIGKEDFEYLIVHNGQIYSSYVEITPRKGKKKLNKDDIQTASNSIEAAAYATHELMLLKEKTNGKSGIVKSKKES